MYLYIIMYVINLFLIGYNIYRSRRGMCDTRRSKNLWLRSITWLTITTFKRLCSAERKIAYSILTYYVFTIMLRPVQWEYRWYTNEYIEWIVCVGSFSVSRPAPTSFPPMQIHNFCMCIGILIKSTVFAYNLLPTAPGGAHKFQLDQ